MTTIEAIEAVERALTNLDLVDRFGEPLIGLEAVAPVARFGGAEWDRMESEFQSGAATPEEYYRRAKYFIDSYGRSQTAKRLSAKIEDLRLDQIELDLLEGA
jgi:hypothetical protein